MKGKAARVGSSEPQALFIMIFKDFFLGCSDCDARPSSGKENSCARKRRRAILFSPTAWISKEMIAANCTLFLHDVHGPASAISRTTRDRKSTRLNSSHIT